MDAASAANLASLSLRSRFQARVVICEAITAPNEIEYADYDASSSLT
jgi:hypothetical protein